MRFLILFFMLFFSFSLFAGNEVNDLKKIKNSKSTEEKEKHYLERVSLLSQSNNLKCESVINDIQEYIVELSEDGKIALLVTHLNNSRLGGLKSTPKVNNYKFNETDSLLVIALIKCFKKEKISKKEYDEIKQKSEAYIDPTRKSIFYAISTCTENLDRKSKINFFNSSIKYAKESPIKSLASSVLDVTSLYYLDIEDFEMSIHHQQEGIFYSKEKGLYANTISHLLNIGHIHFNLGNIKEAKKAYFEAKTLSEKVSLDYMSGELYNHLGGLYSSQKDIKESIKYFQQSLLYFYNINNINGLALTHKKIGKTYFDNGDINLAKKNYKLSAQFYKELDELTEKGELYYLISELHFLEDQLNQAEFHIRRAIDIWKAKNHLIPLNKAYLLYGQIKNKKGEYTEAIDYFNQYIKFNDSNYKLETERKVAELSELFKSDEKAHKIAEQEIELEEATTQRLLVQNKLDHAKQRSRLITIILAISLVLFVAIFVIIRIRNKQEQLKKKQREIELQQTLLRSQMNPHFIFNAMSVIQSYIYDDDTVNSSKFLIHFSKLMRLILENNAKEFISLEKELEIINRYLVIQKMRFEDRFEFLIEAKRDEDYSRVFIPPMLVQPFIENAIEHGDLDKVKNGLIRITYEVVESLFVFMIEDNGVGRRAASLKKKPVDSVNHSSMAINLTKGRISLLNKKHKSKGYLYIEDLDKENETGTVVTISTPFKINY